MMNSTKTANNYLRGGGNGVGGTVTTLEKQVSGGHHFLDALPTSPKYYHNALPPAGIIGTSVIGGAIATATTSTAGGGTLPYIKNKSGNIILFTSQA
jgi:hypothetical protein